MKIVSLPAGRGRQWSSPLALCLLLAMTSLLIGSNQLLAGSTPDTPKLPSYANLVTFGKHPSHPIVLPLITDYTIPPVTDGLAPLIDSLPTKQNVVFLGIDDGQNKQPFELQLMKQYNIKASLFLANTFIGDNPEFFKPFTQAGSLVEDHTVNHLLMSHLSYDQQKQEICDEADLQQQQFGRRPILFRPPGGDYNQNTRRAAADCGMKAVVLWIAKANGGSMQYQIGDSLQPGDIVLMHFRPEFASDMAAFVSAERAAGLHTELLEDWLAPSDL